MLIIIILTIITILIRSWGLSRSLATPPGATGDRGQLVLLEIGLIVIVVLSLSDYIGLTDIIVIVIVWLYNWSDCHWSLIVVIIIITITTTIVTISSSSSSSSRSTYYIAWVLLLLVWVAVEVLIISRASLGRRDPRGTLPPLPQGNKEI